ncbi:MarR family winged helix-turn-helix transcriptional regulator [Parahaliea mediterranea]|uniref:Winged helix-turn-helix transcriptional regulator n=1 Tax=Parahaliea mediterranea TaxID=651086 RepID=A0A939DBM8_9GAMM|nr:MarR family winged helix-turn-helix transcriptional regulator [Parahaliea mediterranea]MBN7795085.1 winged helix-turn-helix transcriptional regulator [Parahaliea mediterranea]
MNFDDITEPLDRRLADGLTRLAAVARQLDWQAAESAGLSPTQADILRFVAGRPRGARLTATAAHVGVRKATASDAVAALERKALLKKCADMSDGRAIALKATAKGHRVAREWPSNYARIVDGLSPAEQQTLLGLTVKMIRQLQQRQLIAPQRTCVTCRYFRENVAPGTDTPHYCAFVGAAMAERHLRVDCAEHEPAA